MPRRTRRSRPIPDNTVPSPCLAVCQLDDSAVCVGCFRSQDEIRDWIIATRDDKLAILERVAERRAQAKRD